MSRHRSDLEVHLTLVVLRGGQVHKVEHALLRDQAARRVAAGWPFAPAAAPGRAAAPVRPLQAAPAARRGARRAGLYLLLACLCFAVSAAFWR